MPITYIVRNIQDMYMGEVHVNQVMENISM